MISATKRKVQRINEIQTFPSPVGGLNARDTLITMKPEDAPLLRNMIVQPYGVGVRNGSVQHATNLGGEVQTLLTWQAGNGSKMWAAATDNATWWLQEITASGSYLAVPHTLTGLTSVQFRQTNFSNSAGTHMVAVNGQDDPVVYNSTAGLTRLTAGNGIVPYTINAVNPNTFVAVAIHQRRLWFVEKNTMKGWYLPTDQVYGVAVKFDFGPIFKLGGYIVGIFSWSKNSYAGPQDQLVVVTSEGEAAVYIGIDPAAADTWSLVGVNYIGAPVGYNFGMNASGDLVMLTEQLLLSMNLATQDTAIGIDSTRQISAKIQKLLDVTLSGNQDEYGWQVAEYPAQNLLIINTPTTNDGIFQMVLNTITKGWSTLQGFDAVCWRLFRQDLFYGDSNGTVYQGLIGFRDGILLDGSGGDPIDFEAQQAFNTLGTPANKYVSMVRPSVVSAEPPSILVGVMFDYNVETVFGDLATAPVDAAFWDSGLWNEGLWGSGLLVNREWTTVGGVGYTAAIRFKGSSASETLWVATDWIYTAGPGL